MRMSAIGSNCRAVMRDTAAICCISAFSRTSPIQSPTSVRDSSLRRGGGVQLLSTHLSGICGKTPKPAGRKRPPRAAQHSRAHRPDRPAQNRYDHRGDRDRGRAGLDSAAQQDIGPGPNVPPADMVFCNRTSENSDVQTSPLPRLTPPSEISRICAPLSTLPWPQQAILTASIAAGRGTPQPDETRSGSGQFVCPISAARSVSAKRWSRSSQSDHQCPNDTPRPPVRRGFRMSANAALKKRRKHRLR